MPALPSDQARVLRTLYEWRFVGRGDGPSRSRLERVPDYIVAAELDGSGIDVPACLDALAVMGFVKPLGAGDSGGTWKLPGGRVLRVTLRHEGDGPKRLYYADVYVQDAGGSWRPISELAGREPCGKVYDVTPAGMSAAEGSSAGATVERIPDATNGVAEQARAFLAWAQREIHDGVFLRGAVGELKQRVARLLFALARGTSDAVPADGDAAARLWRFFSSVDPRQQPVGHRQFVESFHAGEPTDRTLRDLHRCEMLSVGPPSSVDMRSWEHAVGTGFAGPAAVAELLAAVRGVAALDTSPKATTRASDDQSELLWTDRKVRVYKPGGGEPELVPASALLTPLWDARPLESDSWGNILGFDDGLGGGDFIDMRLWLRATPGMVNEPPMYRPAHAPLPPFFNSGGARRCYRPTDEDVAAVRALYPAQRNPNAPPWQRIEADLIVAGHDRAKLVDLNPPALLGLLRKAREHAGAGHNAPKRDEQSISAETPTYTVGTLREMTGLENTALNRYAKRANVQTPARGERNFMYTRAEVRAILQTIIANTAEDALREKCKTALQNLPEIGG